MQTRVKVIETTQQLSGSFSVQHFARTLSQLIPWELLGFLASADKWPQPSSFDEDRGPMSQVFLIAQGWRHLPLPTMTAWFRWSSPFLLWCYRIINMKRCSPLLGIREIHKLKSQGNIISHLSDWQKKIYTHQIGCRAEDKSHSLTVGINLVWTLESKLVLSGKAEDALTLCPRWVWRNSNACEKEVCSGNSL